MNNFACPATAATPSMVYSQSIEKVKEQPSRWIGLCLSGLNIRFRFSNNNPSWCQIFS